MFTKAPEPAGRNRVHDVFLAAENRSLQVGPEQPEGRLD